MIGLRHLAIVLFLAVFAGAAVPAVADDTAPAVAIAGQVQHPVTLTISDLQKLPRSSVSISFETDHGAESAAYAGALLWTVLANAGPIDAPGKNAKLRHTYLVTGDDGYAVSLSEGELDPNFEGKSVLLAYEKDGKPLDSASGIRLVVPGDKHGGRAVHNVVRIDVQ
jgi:DMSO/TMAO reductase YedYZ molybdopterin-dependent catalytic subunit